MENRSVYDYQGKWTTGAIMVILIILYHLLVGSAAPASFNGGNTTFHVTKVIPVQFQAYMSCAANGEGEIIAFSGTLKEFIDGTRTSFADVTFSMKSVPYDVIGEGQATGVVFRAAGTENITSSYRMENVMRFTFVNRYLYTASDVGNHSVIIAVFHEVSNDNGNVNITVENISFECG